MLNPAPGSASSLKMEACLCFVGQRKTFWISGSPNHRYYCLATRSLHTFSLQTQPLANGGCYTRRFWRAGISSAFHCSPWGRHQFSQGVYWGGNRGGTGPCRWAVGAILLSLLLVSPPPPARGRAAASPVKGSPAATGGLPAWWKGPTAAAWVTAFGQALRCPHSRAVEKGTPKAGRLCLAAEKG